VKGGLDPFNVFSAIYISLFGFTCHFKKHKIVFLFVIFLAMGLSARENSFAAANDVTGNALSTNENNSMPIGNGDIVLNVWTEQKTPKILNFTLCFPIVCMALADLT
jgi:Domain of unknown function (DUF5703)